MTPDFSVYIGVVTQVFGGVAGEVVAPTAARYSWVARNVFNQDDTLGGMAEVPFRRIEDVDVRIAPTGSPVMAWYVGNLKVFIVIGETEPSEPCTGGA